MILLWFLIAFLSGSLPFSVWIGKLALHKDIRDYGDGNPGMTNVIRAGGKGWGVIAMLLDGLKGAIPVGLAYWVSSLDGLGMASVAVAPVLGHAFSPFLNFRGGKAIAVTFGVWTGLTLWKAPILLGASVALWIAIFSSEGWSIFLAMTTLLFYLLIIGDPAWMLATWAVNFAILLWKQRLELRQPLKLRPWLRHLFIP